ncbi:MAG: cation:proton antiporter [Thermodesulfobacteriota bacterium]
MTEELIIGLAGIMVMGISAQWVAWRLKIPSILLLLFFGFMAGPITGFINTDEIFGDILFPVVSLSVAIILFEGGLSLKLSKLRATGIVAQRLITVGMVTSWVVGSAAAYYILGLDKPIAMLLGAILVVTGPTVIIPLLRQIRTTERVASILRWEGILIDPIGAVLAVLVYEAMIAGTAHKVPTMALALMGKSILIGGSTGMAGAILLVLLLRRYWVPDFLQNPVALMIVLAVFTVSDLLLAESGLLAVTVMGVVLANQKTITVKHITQFKEDLGVLLISGLFIILAARLRMEELAQLNVWSLLFLISLVVVARPAAVFVSTIFSELKWKERFFIALLAPRGIVAVAIASVFALRLMEEGYHRAGEILPVTFLVIMGTVTFYGIGGPYFARRLGVAQLNPQGVIILGAHSWAVTVAKMLTDSGFKAVLVDTNRSNIYAARMEGLPTYYGSGLTEATLAGIELEGIGKLLAMTPNNSVNSLAVLHFNEIFDSSELYQLPPTEEKSPAKEGVSRHLRGRYLFGPEITYAYLAGRFARGAVLKKTRLTEEFCFETFIERYGEETVPLFLITESEDLVPFTAEKPPAPRAGSTLIALVTPVEEPAPRE